MVFHPLYVSTSHFFINIHEFITLLSRQYNNHIINQVKCSEPPSSSPALSPRAVCGDWSHVLDTTNLHPSTRQSPQSRLCPWTRGLGPLGGEEMGGEERGWEVWRGGMWKTDTFNAKMFPNNYSPALIDQYTLQNRIHTTDAVYTHIQLVGVKVTIQTPQQTQTPPQHNTHCH